MDILRKILAATILSVVTGTVPALFLERTITVGALENGTVGRELETIKAHRFDTRNGFTLQVVPFAGNPAIQIAMQGKEVDTIVSDFPWVA